MNVEFSNAYTRLFHHGPSHRSTPKDVPFIENGRHKGRPLHTLHIIKTEKEEKTFPFKICSGNYK